MARPLSPRSAASQEGGERQEGGGGKRKTGVAGLRSPYLSQTRLRPQSGIEPGLFGCEASDLPIDLLPHS